MKSSKRISDHTSSERDSRTCYPPFGRLKKAIVASTAAPAKEIGEEGGNKEQELVDGVLALEGVGRELRTWGIESGVEVVRAIRKFGGSDCGG